MGTKTCKMSEPLCLVSNSSFVLLSVYAQNANVDQQMLSVQERISITEAILHQLLALIMEHFGAMLRPSWAFLKPSWTGLGPSWAVFPAFLASLAALFS